MRSQLCWPQSSEGSPSELPNSIARLILAAPHGDAGRAFAIFYTSVIGAGGVAPIVCRTIADHSSQAIGIVAARVTAAAIVLLIAALRPALGQDK